MGATLSRSERRILEAAHDAETGDRPGHLTDVVRHRLGQLPGPEFRRGVATLTFLGRRAIGR